MAASAPRPPGRASSRRREDLRNTLRGGLVGIGLVALATLGLALAAAAIVGIVVLAL